MKSKISSKRMALVAIWAASLMLAGQWGHTQTPKKLPVQTTIISGNYIGFRFEGMRGASALGTFVVKMDGEWIPIGSTPGMRPLAR